LKGKLPDYMVPSVFMLLDELPRTPNGKVDRRRLPAPKQERPETGFVAPRDIVEFQLARIWEEVLGIDKVGVRDVFFDMGGHSILAVRLMAQIQKVFGQDLPLSTLFQGATIEHLAGIIRQNDGSPFRSPLIPMQPEGSNPPLFLIHPAGGSVLCYFELARHLAPDQPVFGFQSAGLYKDQEPYASLEDMAASYNRALRSVQAEGPYFLGGISMGGILAFEMAQQLRAEGEEIALLAMFDTSALNARKERRSIEELFEGDDTPLLVSILPKNVTVSAEYLRQFKAEDRLIHILDKLKEKNLVPYDFGLAQIQRYVNAFKLNVYTVNRYELRPYAGRITLFLAESQSDQTFDDMTKGWGELAAGGVEVHRVPGDHISMLSEPHVESLARLLKQFVCKAGRD
jgi:thioesterase domain-containing protein